MIAGGAVLGGLVWLLAAGALRSTGAWAGISLFDAHVGVLPGVLILLLAGLPALVLGLMVSATGHPLAGVFVVATGLTFVAGAGGSMQGYVWRHALPAGYGWLLMETLLWAALLLGLLALVRRLRPGVRQRLTRIATDEHWGDELEITFPNPTAWLAGGVSLVGGGAIAWLLLQSDATGQVIGSLILAFTVGGLLAQLIIPQPNPVPILLSPLALGAIAYVYVLMQPALGTQAQIMQAWYQHHIWGPAIVLPIFYASAGVVGCTMGIGLGQAIHWARHHAMED